MIRNALICAAALAASACATSNESLYVKEVTFPEGATVEEKAVMAAGVVPTEAQLAWQKLGLTAFLHFGMNTFTDREWGDGSENPALFNPSELDARQWVRSLRDAGVKLVILTAKHHDGFCLWPTATTAHSVKSSPWLDGKGDVMRQLREACDEYGMKLGVYLSPWDRNAPCYGDSPAYNDMFVDQLTELLTNYGTIDEVWFDGACGEGPNGKKQEYDLDRFREVIARLQPGAVTAIMGDDVRWVGNEKGLGRETEWSSTVMLPDSHKSDQNERLGLRPKAPDLGGREMLEKADKVVWWPSEVDVSIRPGWFYHDTEQPKSLRHLAEIYIQSVGRNSVLLLNVPPDRRGLIASADSLRLREFGQWLAKNFPEEAGGKPVDLPYPKTVNCVVVEEDITKGQHVEEFTVEGLVGGKWQPIASGTTIGLKRILMFDPVEVADLRVNVTKTRREPVIAGFRGLMVELPADDTAGDASLELPKGVTASVNGALYTLRFAEPATVKGFTYAPPADTPAVFNYAAEVSTDNGRAWQPVNGLSGEFSNIQNNPIPQTALFAAPITKVTDLRLRAVNLTNGPAAAFPGKVIPRL